MIKLSIKNFKSIVELNDFELKPLTLLAGINSSGKTSLIQALLLLKQTIESNTKDILYLGKSFTNKDSLNGPFVMAGEIIELIRNKDRKNKLAIELEIDKSQLSQNYDQFIAGEHSEIKFLKISLQFSVNGEIHIDKFRLDIICDSQNEFINIEITSRKNYIIQFSEKFGNPRNLKKSDRFEIEFDNFFPYLFKKKGEEFTLAFSKVLKLDLENIFSKINYIGPHREKPALAISYDNLSKQLRYVGTDGHYTRFVFDNKRDEIIEGYSQPLTTLCDHWLCKKMNMAQKVSFTKDRSQLYRIIITNNDNLEVDLRQMGFGLSQILPIIVQGFLTPIGGTLIVEDPDVHMHPKVQGDLVDFFIDLTKHGRNVLVETHSDHIVTRLRRRIAEKEISSDEYNVSFVENNEDASIYSKVSITGNGAFDKELPEGFLDAQQNDLQGILEARINSRKNNG